MSSPRTHWLGDTETKPAPEPLDRIQALVNTVELPDGPDRLADPADAKPWLASVGLLGAHADVRPGDLDLVRGVREGLRAMLIHNAGGPAPTPEALAPLRDVTSQGTARAELDESGDIVLAAAGDAVPARLIEMLLIVRDAQRDGTWARLKACGNDECQWAFYDRSRNHGGTWCDMSSCGNKLKNRELRARRRGG
ncbi:CGNR zinc finger domain-containing protein [Mycolicibacterium sp. 120270]|uniref:CGNR zinc finger domain-containing protein n=1 Tax=Mycolicibacterium sp. 120270 TaxID=3090600 RepID=UPI00299D5DE2|nr:CGNR zinc finger domain-containing protein [Mycolicibacterium sp. 120270]MDX1883697.1 CGNR zinc finger domain-containing protein [Mycolicibacterium sp. 120270]